MNILAIGNSFSQDATHYLAQLAAADGREMRVCNLYIGGCSLERHWNNILSGAPDYLLEYDGASTERYVAAAEALALEDWDVIVTQQASHDSGLPETYHPYLENMLAWLRERAPGARLLLQQTWAYEIDSLHPQFPRYHQDQAEMYAALKRAYADAASANGVELIPCGDVIQALRGRDPFRYGHGGMSICRDGFHMNLIYGRYLLAAVWYRTLTGRTVSDIPFLPATKLAPHAICDEAVLAVVQKTVDETAQPPRIPE